jgi:hypothetical protein
MAISTENYICPHCGENQNYDIVELNWRDGQEKELSCLFCNKKNYIRLTISCSWETLEPERKNKRA